MCNFNSYKKIQSQIDTDVTFPRFISKAQTLNIISIIPFISPSLLLLFCSVKK